MTDRLLSSAPPGDHAVLDTEGRGLLFENAHSVKEFSDEPVTREVLTQIWELAKWPPTAWNCQPLRVIHVASAEGKARLLPHIDDFNRSKVAAAPVTTILAADYAYHEDLPELFPKAPGLRDMLEQGPPGSRIKVAHFNATLQAGYFVLAARAVGVSVGPMAGFDSDGVTAEFLCGGTFHALTLLNLGYPARDASVARLPRLPEERVVTWV